MYLPRIVKKNIYHTPLVGVFKKAVESVRSKVKFSRKGEPELLEMSGLCVIDGYLLSMLLSGEIEEFYTAAIFGLSAFSGVGCISIVPYLEGSMRQRIASVTKIYSLVGIGALVLSVIYPFISNFVFLEFKYITAVIVVLIGMIVSGIERLRNFAILINPKRVFLTGMILSVVVSVFTGVSISFALQFASIQWVLFALIVGFCETIAATVATKRMEEVMDMRVFSFFAGTTLMTLGLGIAFPLISSVYAIGVFTVGVIASFSLIPIRNMLGSARRAQSRISQ